MVKEPADSVETVEDRLEIPTQSNVSTVLNGMGNGLMIGAVPFLLLKTGQQILGKRLPVSEALIDRFGTFGSVGGCLLGAAFGAHEATSVHSYRLALKNEIQSLHDKASNSNAKIIELQRALDAKEKSQQAAR